MTSHLRSRRDGWFEWTSDDVTATVSVRFDQDDVGRHHVAEMRLSGGVTNEVLRSIPIGRIEATADAALGAWRALPTEVIAKARAEIASQLPDQRSTWTVPTSSRVVSRGSVTTIDDDRPRRGKPDSFYRDVAALYQGLSAETSKPAAMLAEVRNVPVSTAHRWVRECRRRGFLPPGRRGKAG